MGKISSSSNTKNPQKSRKILAILALVLAGFLWGVNYPVVKIGLEYYSPIWYWLVRYIIATILFVIIFYRKSKPIPVKYHLRLAVNSWIGLSASAMFVYFGLQYSRGMDASVIAALGPIILYWMAVRLLKEKFHVRTLIGTFVAFFGVLIIGLQPFLDEGMLESLSILGGALFLIGIVLDDIGTVYMKPLVERYDWHSIMLWRFIYALIPIAILAAFIEPMPKISLEPAAIFSILYGVFAIALVGFALFYFGLKHLKGVQLSVLFYIDPIVGAFASAIILGEHPGTFYFAGASMVGVGILITELHVLQYHHSLILRRLRKHVKPHI